MNLRVQKKDSINTASAMSIFTTFTILYDTHDPTLYDTIQYDTIRYITISSDPLRCSRHSTTFTTENVIYDIFLSDLKSHFLVKQDGQGQLTKSLGHYD